MGINLKRLGDLAGKFHLYELMQRTGIEALAYRQFYKERMAKTRSFFAENRERTERIMEAFSDGLSREVYGKALAYRGSYRKKDRPPIGPGKQYFTAEVIERISRGGVFVDCGAFTGDTVDDFIEASGNGFKKIVAFEPEQKNLDILSAKYSGHANIVIIPSGVWSCDTTLSFYEGSGSSSYIIDEKSSYEFTDGKDRTENVITVPVKSIDGEEACRDASFIKMDIEGSETEALKGAEQTIRRNRPILAICIYHSDLDMIAIPEWIMQVCSGYSFYCRHYTTHIVETVFYAIPN